MSEHPFGHACVIRLLSTDSSKDQVIEIGALVTTRLICRLDLENVQCRNFVDFGRLQVLYALGTPNLQKNKKPHADFSIVQNSKKLDYQALLANKPKITMSIAVKIPKRCLPLNPFASTAFFEDGVIASHANRAV